MLCKHCNDVLDETDHNCCEACDMREEHRAYIAKLEAANANLEAQVQALLPKQEETLAPQIPDECPNCLGKEIEERVLISSFDYKGVVLSVPVPVWCCKSSLCGYQWTDYRAENLRDTTAAIHDLYQAIGKKE